jgi:predicted nucleic acid-binding Zn ribbon protein
MPTYVYKFVDTGETIEVQQAFTDDTLREYVHPASGVPMPVKKVFQPVGVTFKGSGFFKTDNRGANGSKSKSDTGSESSGSSSGGSSGDSGSSSSGSAAGSSSTSSPSSGSSSTGASSSGSGSD